MLEDWDAAKPIGEWPTGRSLNAERVAEVDKVRKKTKPGKSGDVEALRDLTRSIYGAAPGPDAEHLRRRSRPSLSPISQDDNSCIYCFHAVWPLMYNARIMQARTNALSRSPKAEHLRRVP